MANSIDAGKTGGHAGGDFLRETGGHVGGDFLRAMGSHAGGELPPPITALSAVLKKRFGETVRKVPLDIGASCPTRDGTAGTGGCAFCSVPSFSPGAAVRTATVPRNPLEVTSEFVSMAVSMARGGKIRLFLPYVNAYSATHMEPGVLAEILDALCRAPGSVGVAVSTRPDCLGPEVRSILADLAGRYPLVSCEIGLQTCRNSTLAAMGRGHTASDFAESVCALAGTGVETVGHLIVGLPGESQADFEASADFAVQSGCLGLKFHNFHVLRGTPMEREYAKGSVEVMTIEGYAGAMASLLPRVPGSIVVHRLSASAKTSNGLIAPDWTARPAEVREKIFALMRQAGTRQGFLAGKNRSSGVSQ